MPRPLLLPLLVAVVGAIALIAMHGVSAHGHAFERGGHEVIGSPRLLPADPSAAGHDHSGHEHDDSGGPCGSCSPGSAALCALIVIGFAWVARRRPSSLSIRPGSLPRPPRRTWSPEPPVPRIGLVLTPV